MNAGHVSGQCIRRDSNPHWTEFETASFSSWDTDAKWAGWVPGPPPPEGTGFTVRRVCRFAAGPDDVFAQKPACAACNCGHQGKKEPAAGNATGSSFILYTGGPSFRPLGPHTGRFRKRSMLLLFSRSKRYRADSSELKYTTCIAFMVSSSFVFLHPSYHVKIPDVNATCGCILSNLSVSQNNTLPAYCKVSVYYSERIKSLRIKLIQYNRCTRTHKGNVLLRDVRPARGNELKCKHFIRFLYAFSVILIPGDYNGPRIKIITGNTLCTIIIYPG